MSLLDQGQDAFRITPFGCEFTVYGVPQQAGSKKGFIKKGENGKQKVVIVDDNKADMRKWRNNVETVAAELMGPNRSLYEGPLMLVVEFYMPRPKSHYGVHGVRRSARRYPDVRPDCSKLIRPLEDALSGILWKDDSQIVEEIVRKRYGDPPRARVKLAVIVA